MKKLSIALTSVATLVTFTSLGGIVHADVQHGGDVQTIQKSSPNGATFYTQGQVTTSGSIVNKLGMKIDDRGATHGLLELNYKVTKTGSVSLKDHTYTYFTVPEEFYNLMDKSNIAQYISGHFTFNTALGAHQIKPYTPDDISVVGNHMIRVDNGTNSSLIGQTAETTIDIDLGRAVTNSNQRIPDAFTSYIFHSTTSTDNALIDWNLVGSSDASASLYNITKIDPGYGYEKEKPYVNDVHDGDKTVTGTAKAGSKISVYNNNNKLIGHGTTQDNGEYNVKIEKPYKLEDDDEINVTQNYGPGESLPTVVIVKPKAQPSIAKSNFQNGYWDKEVKNLVIEGKISSSNFDFGARDNTNFTLNLKNSKGEIKCSTPSSTTNFYNPSIFDGYQSLINVSNLGSLPKGTYTVEIQANNTKGGIVNVPMMAANQNTANTFHKVWNEIESKNLDGKTITFDVDSKGQALITIK